jgi:hypothetical protein
MDSAAHEQWTQVNPSDSSRTADLTTEKKTTDASKKNVADESSVPDKTAAMLPDNKKTDNTPAKKEQPVITKPAAAVVTPPASTAAIGSEKKTAAAPKKKVPSTPEVLPPDESDARILNIKRIPVKKTGAKNEDDILQDDGAANGFNTGIKKDSKKKDQ